MKGLKEIPQQALHSCAASVGEGLGYWLAHHTYFQVKGTSLEYNLALSQQLHIFALPTRDGFRI
jgi:hypothetical protein